MTRISCTIEGFNLFKADIQSKPTGSAGKMSVQSITFPGSWDKARVQAWLKKRGYKTGIEKKGDRWRARQFNPEHFESGKGDYATIKKEGDIQFVLGRLKTTRKKG